MSKFIKDSVFNLAKSFGFELVPMWRIRSLEFELFLKKLFALYSVDAVIDVGANLGQYRDFIRNHIGFKGWIVSFEPDPACVIKLQARAEHDHKWHVEPVALGAVKGELNLNVSVSSDFNSFRSSALDTSVEKQFGEKIKLSHVEKVAVRTLDDCVPLFDKLGIQNPYLKLDTQGFDLDVMQGASRYLPTVRAIQTEASVVQIYSDMPDYRKTQSFLSEAGFDWANAFPVSHDPALRLVEFDCIAVNSRYAVAICQNKKPTT